MSSSGIDRNEWLSALTEATQASLTRHPDALTLNELEKVFGLSRSRAAARVRILIKAGLAEEVTAFHLRPGDLRPRPVPAYRLLKSKQKK